jgi:hypothetical protein
MNIDKKEMELLRELAKRYSEIACLPVMENTRRSMIDNNDLKPGRPQVLIDEVPWHEMDIDGKLRLICKDEFARAME